MRVYVAHLKSGKCPRSSKEVTRKGFKRCRIKMSGHGMYGRKRK
jgi:hypothetical protein